MTQTTTYSPKQLTAAARRICRNLKVRYQRWELRVTSRGVTLVVYGVDKGETVVGSEVL